jgi:hypothetical protein
MAGKASRAARRALSSSARDQRIVTSTPISRSPPTGASPEFPERAFDLGIAESGMIGRPRAWPSPARAFAPLVPASLAGR